MDVTACLFVLLCIGTAHGSHMYGMHITWQPSAQNLSLIDVAMKITSSGSTCSSTSTYVASFTTCPTNGSPCNSVSANRTYVCQTNSILENWRTEIYEYKSALPSTKQFSISYATSCCWRSAITGFDSRTVESLVDLGIRSDTGAPNNPPKVAYVPVNVFQLSCADQIQLIASDPNGDRISCRIGNLTECGGGSCNTYPYFTMDEVVRSGNKSKDMVYAVRKWLGITVLNNITQSIAEELNSISFTNCQLIYNGGGSATYVGVWIFVEDFPRTTITLDGTRTVNPNTRLSSIPIQINIKVVSSSISCGSRPTFINPTPIDASSFYPSASNPLNLNITVQSSQSGTFYVSGPNTLIQQPMTYSGGVATQMLSYGPNTTNFIDRNQYICYYFVSSSSGVTQQRCAQISSTGSNSNPCLTDNGGCSDVCTWNGGSTVQCSCYRSCWILANDGKNCVPDIEVSCPSHSMNLTIPVCSIDGLVGLSNYTTNVAPASCQHNTTNGNYRFYFAANECNTIVEELPLKIRLANTIKVWIESNSSSGSGFITRRGNFYNIPVSCYYSRFANITQVFGVQEQNTSIDALSVPGLGDFTFDFDFFKNVDFAYAYSPFEYPVPYEINSDVFFGIRSTSSVPNVQLFTKACWAVPFGSENSGVFYQLIDEGCPMDETIQVYSGNGPAENLFSVKAFRFRYGLPGITSSTRIAIQCTIQVCVIGLNTRCSQGCISSPSGRKRREINGDENDASNLVKKNDDDDDTPISPPSFSTFQSPDHDVATTGPIIIILPKDDSLLPPGATPATAEPKNELTNMIMIAVLTVGVVLLFVALGAIGWRCHKRAYRAKEVSINLDEGIKTANKY